MKKPLMLLVLCLALVLSAPVASATEDAVALAQPMLGAMDSLMRAAQEIASDPAGSDYGWTALYLMGVNFGDDYPGVERTDDGGVRVPAPAMRAFAGALLGWSELADIPQSMADSIQHDAADDSYRLAGSDIGDSSTRIDRAEQAADGTLTVYAVMESMDGERLAEASFKLTPNPQPDALLPYRVEVMP